jgi:hypothetical protein
MSKRRRSGKSQQVVRVVNPTPLFKGPYGPDTAISLIKQGFARAHASDPWAIIIISRATGKRIKPDDRENYDRCVRSGLAKLEAVRHIPVAMPEKVFTLPTKRTRKPITRVQDAA